MLTREIASTFPLNRELLLSRTKGNYNAWRLRVTALLTERFAMDIVLGRLGRPQGPPRMLGRELQVTVGPRVVDGFAGLIIDGLNAQVWDDAHAAALAQILVAVSDDVLTNYEAPPEEEYNKATHLWTYIEGLFLGHPTHQSHWESGYRLLFFASAPRSAIQDVSADHALGLDGDGKAVVFFGSVILDKSIVPCKVAPEWGALWPNAGKEHGHAGPFTVLAFDLGTMELVPTSHGKIPIGRHPVIGGHREDGSRLYHAVGVVAGCRTPGKAGDNAPCCYVGYDGGEHALQQYELLCWRD